MEFNIKDFKLGIYEFNPDNFYGCKSWEEVWEDISTQIDFISLEKNELERCKRLAIFLGMSFGEAITKEAFIRILKYLKIDYNVFEKHILETEECDVLGILTFWFHSLDCSTYIEAIKKGEKLQEQLRQKIQRKVKRESEKYG